MAFEEGDPRRSIVLGQLWGTPSAGGGLSDAVPRRPLTEPWKGRPHGCRPAAGAACLGRALEP